MCPNEMFGYKKQRGAGLPVAIFIITVLALVTVALTQLEEGSGVGFSVDVNSMRAFYAAESGGQVGMNQLFPPGAASTSCAAGFFVANDNRATSPSLNFSAMGVPPAGLALCKVWVQCGFVTVGSDTFYTLTSTGRCGNGLDEATRVITLRARQ